MQEKIIRDAVHGNIILDERFLAIIDTPEFQRLHRIKQLSTEYLVFPTAQHTRFSHSVGTYHVMSLLINHFDVLLRNVGIKISQDDKDSALAVALLHDVGHGPFSHAFEHALPKGASKKHEEWTREIIMNPSSSINKVLVSKFSKEFPEKLNRLMKKNSDAKKGTDGNTSEVKLFNIISSLISSKLDADRMDYLLRDSYFTGVTLGNFDIHRLIEALDINVIGDDVQVCVKEKYLTVIEEYILARYHMYNDLYYHPFKNEMEMVVNKILKRIYELTQKGIIDKEFIPKGLLPIMNNQEMTFEDYISLDDTVFFHMFSDILNDTDDIILKRLCDAFVNRKKFTRISIKNYNENIDLFKKEYEDVLRKNGYISSLDDAYFWLDYCEKNQLYKNAENKNSIYVLCREGNIREISQMSSILSQEVIKKIGGAFVDEDIMLHEMKLREEEFENIKEELKEIKNRFDNRLHVEIEKKYVYENQCVKCSLLAELKKWYKIKEEKCYDENSNDYVLKAGEIVDQVDIYYDNEKFDLKNNNKTLRIRKNKDKYKLTIKGPITNDVSVNSDSSQQARQENEFSVNSSEIVSRENRNLIKEYLPDVYDNINQYSSVLEVKNRREKYTIANKYGVKLEMAFDDVSYLNLKTLREYHEYQIEIELKSLDYRHRVNLKEVTDYIEEKIKTISVANESKYVRGLNHTR